MKQSVYITLNSVMIQHTNTTVLCTIIKYKCFYELQRNTSCTQNKLSLYVFLFVSLTEKFA